MGRQRRDKNGMKTAFLYGSLSRGGAERVITSLANDFVERGNQVDIITLRDEEPGYQIDSRVHVISLRVAGNSENVIQAVWRNIKTVFALRKYLRKANLDQVVAFNMRLAVQVLLANPFHRGYKVIVSERANPMFAEKRGLEWLFRVLLLDKADRFIFQTSRVQRCFPEKIIRKGVVIPNGVFSDQILESVVPFDERKKNVICSVGRLVKQKGYDVLIQAFAQFSKDHSGYVLDIFGEGPEKSNIDKLINDYGMTGKVVLRGNVSNVIEEIHDAGMFILASRFEGMPNALIEAMACGIPCIASNCDFGPGELIENEDNGLLFPVDDVDALVSAMTTIADDESFAEKLSRNAQQIRETHSREKIIGMYKDAIYFEGDFCSE